MTPLKAGDIAPKFSLPDQDGEEVNLTDFQGQRVHIIAQAARLYGAARGHGFRIKINQNTLSLEVGQIYFLAVLVR